MQIDAENTHRVFDWLWTSGQLSARDIGALPGLGVGAVVNLALPTSSNALAGEAERVSGLGMTYVQIPVSWESPGAEQLAQFLAVLGAFERQELRVWVHCALNMRVSAFVYLYRRLVRHEGDEAARHPLREVWTLNPTWQAFIDGALRTQPAASTVPRPDVSESPS